MRGSVSERIDQDSIVRDHGHPHGDAREAGFFFQAEDGIRDKLVTGVQTCAFFFQAEDGIRDKLVTGVQTCLFRSVAAGGGDLSRRRRSPPTKSAWRPRSAGQRSPPPAATTGASRRTRSDGTVGWTPRDRTRDSRRL